MTEPQPVPQPVQPVDAGNALLAECQAQLAASIAQTPTGMRMALTIRTPSTTLTLFLNKADATAWAAQINGAAAQMSASLIAAPANGIAGLGLNGGRDAPQ